MITLSNISFLYQNSTEVVLRNVSLEIPDGSCVAIVGNSGCGKSTLLNLIAGVLKPTRGRISVGTKDISYLMQEATLLPYITAFENTLLAYRLRNNRIDDETIVKARNMLREFRMESDAFKKFPHELSGGMRQKVGLVQTLLTDSKLLLLDEPFNAIDEDAQEIIEKHLWDDMKENKRTMVFITHDLESALHLSDKIVVMGNHHHHAVHEINLDDHYVSLTPSERENTGEYTDYFFEMKSFI